MKKFSRKSAALWLFFGLGIIVDQWTKSIASGLTINQGISFGLHLYGWEIFMAILLIVGLFLIWQSMERAVLRDFSFTLLLSGAVSNLIDRLLFAGVRDWLVLPGVMLHNNLADVLLVLGVFGIIVSLIYETRRQDSI
jgi:lipoprotein signal peptidase